MVILWDGAGYGLKKLERFQATAGEFILQNSFT
jgi:hypothetical protein